MDTIRVLDVFGVAASARSRYLVACATIRRELAGGLPHQEGARSIACRPAGTSQERLGHAARVPLENLESPNGNSCCSC